MGRMDSLLTASLSKLPQRRRAQVVDAALGGLAEASYYRLASRGFNPSAIVDVGAYEGCWTRLVRTAFPNPPVLMIEAQDEKRPDLTATANACRNVMFEMCLLGPTEGATATFHVMETGSSLYSERSNAPRSHRQIQMRTLDNVLASFDLLREPLFLKLDVQGAELDVLRGGQKALAAAEIVQLEVALTSYNEGAPEAHEVITFMEETGFSIYDVCGFVRPDPQCLSQIDILFARKSSKLRKTFFTF